MLKLAALAVCGIWATTASAELIINSEIRYGNWAGGAYSNDEAGDFSHCVISTSYRNGHELFFSVNVDGLFNVGISNEDWNFDIGDEYNVSFQVDKRASFSGYATALTPQMAMFSISDLDGALDTFRKGRTLSLTSNTYQVEFDLTGTYRALDTVLNCALYYYNNPLAPGETNASDTSKNTVDKTLLFQIATAMINEAGARDFQYLTEVELEEIGLPGSVMWNSETLGVVSGVFVSTVDPSTTDLRMLSAEASSEFSASCEGDAATSSSDASTSELLAREVRVICKSKEGDSDTFYRQVMIGDQVLSTVTIFDGGVANLDQDAARISLSEAMSVEAASFLLEVE